MMERKRRVQWIEIPVIILCKTMKMLFNGLRYLSLFLCKTLKMFLLNLVIIGVKLLDSIFQ